MSHLNVLTVEKTQIKKKRQGIAHFLKKKENNASKAK